MTEIPLSLRKVKETLPFVFCNSHRYKVRAVYELCMFMNCSARVYQQGVVLKEESVVQSVGVKFFSFSTLGLNANQGFV